MRKNRTSPSNGRGNIVVLSEHKAYKAATKRSAQSRQEDKHPSTAEEAHAARAPDGLLLVEHFDDGTQKFSITGFYRHAPMEAMSAAIGLATLVRNLWETMESHSPDNV